MDPWAAGERAAEAWVVVWPGQRVRIAIRFTANRGYFTYHWHILEHEDAGMMRNFLVA